MTNYRHSEDSPARREMLPGFPASEWEQINVRVARIGWALIVLLVPIIIGVKSGISWLGPVAIAAMILGLGAITWYNVGLGASTKRIKEHKAGYTTEWKPYMPLVDLCAPRTGSIVRRAGASQINQQQYETALEESRNLCVRESRMQ